MIGTDSTETKDPEDWATVHKYINRADLIVLHDYYYRYWQSCASNLEDYDDMILNLLNEIEDLYNPGRLNGN